MIILHFLSLVLMNKQQHYIFFLSFILAEKVLQCVFFIDYLCYFYNASSNVARCFKTK